VIHKSNFRISSFGEKRDITFLGIASNKRRKDLDSIF
jgi:hypothetical protein